MDIFGRADAIAASLRRRDDPQSALCCGYDHVDHGLAVPSNFVLDPVADRDFALCFYILRTISLCDRRGCGRCGGVPGVADRTDAYEGMGQAGKSKNCIEKSCTSRLKEYPTKDTKNM